MSFFHSLLYGSGSGSGEDYSSYFILAVAGDSNKDGRGLAASRPAVPADTLFQWNGTGLDEITTATVSNDGDYGSLVQNFAIKLKADTGKKTIVINGAWGGAYITSQPGSSPPNNDWSATGILYAPFEAEVDAVLTFTGKTAPDVIVFGDGINDIRSGPISATIATAFDNLISRLHTSFPNVPIILTQVGYDGTAGVTQKLYDLRKYVVDKALSDSLVHIVSEAASFHSAGLYQGDLLHYTQDAYNHQGNMIARWVQLSSYNKMSRCVLSSLFTDLSTNRKDLIASVIDGLVTRSDFGLLEILHWFFTDDVKNTYIDLALMSFGFPLNNTFVANSHIATNGVAQRYIPGVTQSFTLRATQDDFFEGIYLLLNNVAGGSGGTPFGVQNTLPGHGVVQGGATEIYIANDGTLTVSGGTVPLNAPMFHGVARSAGNKYKYENKTQAHTAAVASTGRANTPNQIGCLGGTSNNSFFNGQYSWYVSGKFVGFDFDTFYDEIENARLHWND